MKFVSTRKGFEATSAESVFQGLAPDGGLYVPSSVKADASLPRFANLREAAEYVLSKLFDDLPQAVRTDAVDRLLS
ncbi:MAG: threonine synthase, partial [Kiritimatiellae bacterium]|nr:threonine synthase [Kiritimatiellia bacterium]